MNNDSFWSIENTLMGDRLSLELVEPSKDDLRKFGVMNAIVELYKNNDGKYELKFSNGKKRKFKSISKLKSFLFSREDIIKSQSEVRMLRDADIPVAKAGLLGGF